MWNTMIALLTPDPSLQLVAAITLILFGLLVGLTLTLVVHTLTCQGRSRVLQLTEQAPVLIDEEEVAAIVERVRLRLIQEDGWTFCGECYTRTLLQMWQLASVHAARVSSAPTCPLLHPPAEQGIHSRKSMPIG